MDASSSSSSSDHSQKNQSKKNQSCESSQGSEAPVTQEDVNTARRSDSLGAVTELPQCKMGSKTADDMSFMISCTNWY
ncbi:hypothetical protein PHYPO_G00101360 [Pangasianodon hypophthalmus]|uniref:Uncharacterized protein n=1 Tax=Pangasianodon hypophthalmus TaxID=310915 RepID=A0A5N5PWJ9_PANHP|nr:hypothetical protein PHYPO_G00101360 [Pangasianodon hypophthalmus]